MGGASYHHRADTGQADAIPAVRGAMDVALGAKRTFLFGISFSDLQDSVEVPLTDGTAV